MSEQRAMVCGRCGPGVGELESTMAYRCSGCGGRIYLCRACGLRELRGGWPMMAGWLRCRACGFERELRPEEVEAERTKLSPPAGASFGAAFVPPPMPAFRRGTEIAVGKEPARYRPAKGAR